MVRWMQLHPEDQPTIIVAVIDDSEDDQMAAVFATEDTVPSARFAGFGALVTESAAG
jgi:hypothetical protein